MNFGIRMIHIDWRVKVADDSFTVDWSIGAQQVTQTARGVFLEKITAH